MSDLIRRQDVIDVALEFLVEFYGGAFDEELQKILKKRLETLSSAQQWISCSQHMPEEYEWIGTKMFGTTISDKVCITFDVNGKRFVEAMSLQNGKLSDSDKKTMDAFHEGWKMLAWMPLPEPYEEEK